MIYPAGESLVESEPAQTLLLDRANPQMAAATEPLAGAIPALANMTHNQDTLAMTNDIHHHLHHNGGHQLMQSLPCFNDLIAVLIECFSLIAIGYFSGRFKLISSDSKDIGAYLTTFALPMIIFLNVAQMEIRTINLSFLTCMLVSKLILFVLVTLITLAISYPSNFSYAGALSILATQSNDFALGYPLFKSLYGESKPEMLSYLNLMGPIQLLIINPLGIIMLEFEKSRTNRTLRRQRDAILARKRCLHCLDKIRPSPETTPPASPEPTQTVSKQGPVNPSLVTSQATVQTTGGLNSPIRQPSGDSIQSIEPRGKNIKSLALVMPARVLPERDASDDSADDLIERYRLGAHSNKTPTRPMERSPAGLSSGSVLVDREFVRHRHRGLATISTKPELFSQNIGQHEQAASLRPSGVSVTDATRHQSQLAGGMCPQTEGAPGIKCTCGFLNGAGGSEEAQTREPVIDLSFVKALLTNPLIIASVVALAVNLINGPELPKFVTKVSNTIAASFAAPALFVVGLSMYGKFKLILRNPNDLLLSSVLVLTKVFILPNLMRTIMLMVLPHYTSAEEIPYLADFAYLYGLLPTAPGACIIAKQYEVLTNVVSICMLLSTFISAPMMLGTSAIISQVSATAPETTFNILTRTLRISSSITLTLSLLTIYMLWKTNKRMMGSLDRIMSNVAELKATHVFTFLLTLTQLLIGFGGFLWMFVDTTKLRHSSFVDLFTRDSSSLSSPDGGDPYWPQEDMDDIRSEEERLHTLDPAGLETQAASFGTLCTIKYLLASGGLLMARFAILCIVVTNFAKHFRGHQLAVQVSSLMLKVYPLFGVGIILCLVFESHHLSCMPSESSLPTWAFSLYLRLAFNGLLLLLAVPLFTAAFRLTNRAAWLEAQNMHEVTPSQVGRLEKRRFVTSNVSLSSDTSSAMTTSTNLEATLNLGVNPQSSQRGQGAPLSICVTNDPQHQRPLASGLNMDSTVSSMDYDTINDPPTTEVNAKTARHHLLPGRQHHYEHRDQDLDGFNLGNNALIDSSLEEANQARRLKRLPITQCDINNNNNCGDLYKLTQNNNEVRKVHMGDGCNVASPTHHIPQATEATSSKTTATQAETAPTTANASDRWPPVTEFNKYSILVVFMLFQATISLTSIIQLLNQDKPPGGTFVMGEITNVAMDFGQGLVTFLVIGSQSYLTDLISTFGSSTIPSRQRVDSRA